MNRFLALLLSLSFSSVASVGNAAESIAAPTLGEIEFTRYLYQLGDEPRWAERSWEDGAWYSVYHQGLPVTPQIYWTRNHVMIRDAAAAGPMSVHISLLGAYEVYWDGQLVGASGQVGIDRASEVPGALTNRFSIPEDLYTDGSHVISLRISSFWAPESLRVRYYEIDVVSDAQHRTDQIAAIMLPLVFLGCFLITAVYYQAVYWIVRRDKPLLLFSLLCAFISALLLSQRWDMLIGYNYDWHWANLILMLLLTAGLALLLLTFILYQFNLKHKLWWILGVSILIVISGATAENFENANTQTLMIAIAAALLLTGVALKQNIEGAVPANIGLVVVVISILLDSNNYMERYLFPSFTVLILFMLVSLALRMKKQQENHESSLLMSERLKTELLKRNIQPHFMLNSLASIGELIETDPKRADGFIQGLAEEFKILNSMTDKKLVPLAEELALCESHALISSLRNSVEYRFDSIIEDLNKQVPPAIFHTLLENGITHNLELTGEVGLSLEQIVQATETIYRFSAPLNRNANSAGIGDGTGTKYVKARLEESFPGNWSLLEDSVESRWVTEIRIPEHQATGQLE